MYNHHRVAEKENVLNLSKEKIVRFQQLYEKLNGTLVSCRC